MSFSDEEDFNDIYGDESVTTTATADEPSKEPQQVTEEAKNEEPSAPAPAPAMAHNSSSDVTAATATETTPATATSNTSTAQQQQHPTSQLDQLAALQALSSNLNQLQHNTSNANSNAAAAAAAATATAAPAGMPNMQQWQQLQQTMSQFQQPGAPQQPQLQMPSSVQDQSKLPVKADLSRDMCKMFIGGLNWETTEDNLRDYFSKYGAVTDLKIMRDNATGRSRGFGFLTFAESSSVDEVVKTQHILDGKVIDPKRAIPREEQDKTGKIFVGGIGPDVRPKEFEEFFSQYGTIIDAQLMLDKDTGRSRGFGFITYDTPDAVDRVCQNKFIEFKGKRIEIKRAEPRHLQKQQQQQQQQKQQHDGGNSAGQFNGMFQNPMMGGFNPMFNPQAMAEYYNKMQEYYSQLQQQTGMDYTQMYQQQMQQMQQMMGGMMPGMSGMPNVNSGTPSTTATPNQEESNVPTIGSNSEERKEESTDHRLDGDNDHERRTSSPPPNAPRGPRTGGKDRDSGFRGGYRGDNRGGDNRGGHRGSRGGYRGSRGSYSRRSNGYHPYSR